MKRDLPHAPSPELARLYDELVQEELRQIIRERRVAHREPLIRPLTIELRGSQARKDPIPGFSRNLSPAGIGLITQVDFLVPGELPVGVITILRLNRSASRILAECRWCDDFGDGWFFSGWNFLSLTRS